MNDNERMIRRLKDRENTLKVRIARLIRMVEAGRYGGEAERVWLDQFAIGAGLDICCGDFPIWGSQGVDGDEAKIGAELFGQGDNLHWIDSESMDFIVTNYFDAMPEVLRALNEWWRVLKPGGTLAFVCCNLDKYPDDIGPLQNSHRFHVFTARAVTAYLSRAKFKEIKIDAHGKFLRVVCTK